MVLDNTSCNQRMVLPSREMPHQRKGFALPAQSHFHGHVQLSAMIEEKLMDGQTIGDTTYDFAFDLNEFFSVEEGKSTFKHEKDVKRWLERLTKNEKYPFSTPTLRINLRIVLSV